MSSKTLTLQITGMHCTGCERIIENALSTLPGIISIHADFKHHSATVVFEPALLTQQRIIESINSQGYQVAGSAKSLSASIFDVLIFIILFSAIAGIALWGKGLMPDILPKIHAQMSYPMLFGIGFLTGFHCIGMCGSFVVNYSRGAPTAKLKFLYHCAYGTGKVISYASIGAGFALLGTILTITLHMRGVAALAAGIFLFIFGLKMLNIFPKLHDFGIRLPSGFNQQMHKQQTKKHPPFRIGLLSGLILGCGPLQAMYIMAAGTGDPVEGATLLAFFALGTLGPLLGYGLFANLLSATFLHQLIRVSGLLVMLMAVMMLDRGMTMTGLGEQLWTYLQHASEQVQHFLSSDADSL